MNGWAEDAMREAIDFLARARRNDLASDLNRIFKTINFEDLEIMRSGRADRIANEILEAETVADLTECLKRLAQSMNVSHCTLHLVSENPAASYSTKVLTSYPADWITTYVNRKYYQIDPVVRASRTTSQSFFWDGLDASSPVIRTFWRDAAAHGVGASGYTLPITTEDGDMLALSVSSMQEADDFRDTLAFHESDLFNLSVFLGEAFCRLACERRPATFNPTDDQLMILQAISMGVDEAELEDRSYQYGSYATLKRSICALFQTRTMAQAAILAARTGLLDHAPLLKADIMVASDGRAGDEASEPHGALSLRRLVRAFTPAAGPFDEGMLNAV